MYVRLLYPVVMRVFRNSRAVGNGTSTEPLKNSIIQLRENTEVLGSVKAAAYQLLWLGADRTRYLWKSRWAATLREGAAREQQQKGQRFVVIRGKEGMSLSNTGRRANSNQVIYRRA